MLPVEARFEIDTLERPIVAPPGVRAGVVALVESTRTLLRLACRPEEATLDRLTPLVPQFGAIMSDLGIDAIHALWTYVISVFPSTSPLRTMLTDAGSPAMQQEFETIYDEAIYDEAISKGKVIGVTEGKARMLLRLLEARGLVGEHARRDLLACDDAEIERWFDRALTARSIEDIFDA